MLQDCSCNLSDELIHELNWNMQDTPGRLDCPPPTTCQPRMAYTFRRRWRPQHRSAALPRTWSTRTDLARCRSSQDRTDFTHRGLASAGIRGCNSTGRCDHSLQLNMSPKGMPRTTPQTLPLWSCCRTRPRRRCRRQNLLCLCTTPLRTPSTLRRPAPSSRLHTGSRSRKR